MQRPDLSNVDPLIVEYIEYLERKAGTRSGRSTTSTAESLDLSPERASEALPPEQEGNAFIISLTAGGVAKRTLRHVYTRQHRGGMGVFGIELDEPDYPVVLGNADSNQNLLLFTNRARVFRQSLSVIPSEPVFGKGDRITERLSIEPDETIVAVLPEQARGYVALASETGRVRCLRHHLFGEHMRQGTAVYNYNEFGPLVSACWTPGDAELLLLTQQGIAIRFTEKAIAPQGEQGIRLASGDRLVSVVSIYPDSHVFIVSADGRGTVRLMSGFAPNKSPGGSGKIAIKSTKVAGATPLETNDDVFILSRLGKIIRFPGDEIPTTEGVVQGVNCMGLRGDEVSTVLRSGPIY